MLLLCEEKKVKLLMTNVLAVFLLNITMNKFTIYIFKYIVGTVNINIL